MDQEFMDEIDRDFLENGPGEPPFIRLAKAEQRVRELSAERDLIKSLYITSRDGMRQVGDELETCRAENAELRIALENHNSGSKQLAKWLEESRLEAMDAKRSAASDRARLRMMRVDLAQLVEAHRKDGITALFLALEELIQRGRHA